MKHVFSVVGVGLAAVFVAVFFTGRVDSKHLTVGRARASACTSTTSMRWYRASPPQTGATLGTSRRVVYLLACSGVPTRGDDGSAGARSRDHHRETAHDGAPGGRHGALGHARTRAPSSPLKDC